MVDDDSLWFGALLTLIEVCLPGAETVWAKTVDQGLEEIGDARFDLVFVDYQIGDSETAIDFANRAPEFLGCVDKGFWIVTSALFPSEANDLIETAGLFDARASKERLGDRFESFLKQNGILAA